MKEQSPVGDATTRACWQLQHLPQPHLFEDIEWRIVRREAFRMLFDSLYTEPLYQPDITKPFEIRPLPDHAKYFVLQQKALRTEVKVFVAKRFERVSKLVRTLAWNYSK